MDSHEILRKTVSGTGVKPVAGELNLSTSLIYKWCEPKDGENSGADNPLDRLLALCEVTGDMSPVQWLCERMNGFFVENTTPKEDGDKMEVLVMTQRILREFSELLNMVSNSMANDNRIDKEEALKIRAEWEDLKRVAERFVLGCEMGAFGEKEQE